MTRPVSWPDDWSMSSFKHQRQSTSVSTSAGVGVCVCVFVSVCVCTCECVWGATVGSQRAHLDHQWRRQRRRDVTTTPGESGDGRQGQWRRWRLLRRRFLRSGAHVLVLNPSSSRACRSIEYRLSITKTCKAPLEPGNQGCHLPTRRSNAGNLAPKANSRFERHLAVALDTLHRRCLVRVIGCFCRANYSRYPDYLFTISSLYRD